MSAGCENAIRAPEGVPHAVVSFDPFHVVQLGGKAADQVRRDEYNRHGRSSTGESKWIKGARYSLLKDTGLFPRGQRGRRLPGPTLLLDPEADPERGGTR